MQRWFAFLRAHGGFVYYPYPKANLLGLQDLLVRIHGLKNPAALGILPFAASFNVEVALSDGHPFVSQAYWVPGTALSRFEDFWTAARDLGLLERVDILRVRNTHTIFSPFHEAITPDGRAKIESSVDNEYFGALIRRSLRGTFEIRLSERIAASPLVIPIVVEHIWQHYSSQHVWRAIRAEGDAQILEYGHGVLRKALDRPGAALRLVQEQWGRLLEDFDAVFLQPRVFFDWPSIRDATFLSFLIRTDTDRMVKAAMQASEHAIVTALKPGLGPEGECHVTCFVPNDRMLDLLRIVNESHRGREPPVVALQDRKATLALFQPAFCRLDWRLFDPNELTWRFEADAYMERLNTLVASS